jgi:CRISPR system Cascade subunit CasA
MNLNLIDDAWIPVRRKDGARAVIAPWQMADAALAFPDWPRADLNLACLELLIGLVLLADPPHDVQDWRDREAPDPERLRAKLAPFAPAFNLLGDGPRFLQDLEAFERVTKEISPLDLLIIDCVGGGSVHSLLAKPDRYADLDLPFAAIALYALQAFAPPGGRGNRASMRGSRGPLVTLVEPGRGLFALVWANAPYGSPANAQALPWMRSTRTSELDQQVFPHDSAPVEAFFGVPRRLRLLADNNRLVGVAQRPHGAKYAGWEHPLTPYHRFKAGGELLPRHPRAGAFGFRNWLGVTARRAGDGKDLARRAKVLDLWAERQNRVVDVLVAGWAMDNMKPLDFVFSRAPLIDLDDATAKRMEGLVEAADKFAAVLGGAMAVLVAKGETRDAAKEDFYGRAQAPFEARLQESQTPSADHELIAKQWLADLREAAFDIFDALALPGLSDLDVTKQGQILDARGALGGAFAGYGKLGREAFAALGLPIPDQGKKQKGKAA